MPDILVRDVAPIVVENLKLAARQRKISVAKLVSEILSPQFSEENFPHCHDLDSLAGTWNAADLREFENAIEPLSKVDEQSWRLPRRRK